MKKVLIGILVLMVAVTLSASIRVVSYNCLNYSDDDPDSRLPSFGAVLNAMQADVYLFQEIDNEEGAELLLGVLNNAGDEFAGTVYVNGYDTNNYMVYRTSAVTFAAQDTVMTDLRDISEYEIIVDGNLVRLFSCHLKAGTGDDDELRRLSEVTTLREHIEGMENPAEFLIVGDMNFYASSEAAYLKFVQNETNNDGRAEDLCESVGNWHNSSSYADVHTQSTRSGSGGNAGGSGGGMDDKFDFIFSNYGLNDGQGMEYIADSHIPYGNDGDHFNQSINDGTNSAVPQDIANALYDASDHLPVLADFDFISSDDPLFIVQIPNIREFWQRNIQYAIKWVTYNVTGDVMIELLKVSSGETTTLTAATDNDGEWIWSIPEDQELGDYKVIITSNDNSALNDDSNNYFTIVEQHNPDFSIYDIQYTTEPGSDGTYPSMLNEQVITVTGIVTGADFGADNKFYMSDPQGGAWHGVYVYDYMVGPALGDEVEVTATVQEYFGLTELSLAESITILSSGNIVPEPIEITCAEFPFADGISEQFEGCLLKFNDVTVISEQDEHGQWYVEDATGSIQIDDGFFKFDEHIPPFLVTLGMNFPSIIGCADYSFDEYGIHPRTMADLDLSNNNDENSIPLSAQFLTNYPNPFNPVTTIVFEVKTAGPVMIDIYNVRGEKVITLVNENMNPGSYNEIWDGSDSYGNSVASGLYFYCMSTNGSHTTRKMVLMK